MRIWFVIFVAISLCFAALADVNGLRMGDHLMKRGDYAEALEEYEKTLGSDPDNPEALWRAGSALTHMALAEIGNSRHENLETATNYINRAIAGDSDIIEAHLEYARALGYLALFRPDWDDFRVARRVREELIIVLEEDTDNPEANFLLGIWHRWVGPVPLLKRKPNELGEACVDSALYYFRKASKIDDTNLLYKMEMARTYYYLDSGDKARYLLNEIIDTKDVLPKDTIIVEQAKNELEKLNLTEDER